MAIHLWDKAGKESRLLRLLKQQIYLVSHIAPDSIHTPLNALISYQVPVHCSVRPTVISLIKFSTKLIHDFTEIRGKISVFDTSRSFDVSLACHDFTDFTENFRSRSLKI